MASSFRRSIALLMLGGLLAASGCVGLTPRTAEENWSTFYTFLLIDVVIVGAVIVVVVFFALRARRQNAQAQNAQAVPRPQADADKATAAGGKPCPRCGAPNPRGRRFCRNCGFRL